MKLMFYLYIPRDPRVFEMALPELIAAEIMGKIENGRQFTVSPYVSESPMSIGTAITDDLAHTS